MFEGNKKTVNRPRTTDPPPQQSAIFFEMTIKQQSRIVRAPIRATGQTQNGCKQQTTAITPAVIRHKKKRFLGHERRKQKGSPVGQGLEVHRSRGDSFPRALFLRVRVEAVREVTARGEVEPHDAVVRPEKPGVHRKVGGGSTAVSREKKSSAAQTKQRRNKNILSKINKNTIVELTVRGRTILLYAYYV